ncbi:MAG: biotin transporter BioY [Phycisphaerae bacterium]
MSTATLTQRIDISRRAVTFVREAGLIFCGSLLLAASARLWLPLGPVPVTAQTLAVLLLAGALGGRRAAAATLTYIAQGLAGMPVFAGGGAGPVHLLGPTGGYLVGFVAAGLVCGELLRRGWFARPAVRPAVMALGILVIYAFGALWLASFVGMRAALVSGVAPFVLPDAVKVMLAAILAPRAGRIVNRML